MRNLLFIVFLLPFTLMAQPNISDGKLLYEESCIKCHGDPYLNNGMDEMTSLIELSHMVIACNNYFNLDWNEQDIEDTVHYLNREFFQLD